MKISLSFGNGTCRISLSSGEIELKEESKEEAGSLEHGGLSEIVVSTEFLQGSLEFSFQLFTGVFVVEKPLSLPTHCQILKRLMH